MDGRHIVDAIEDVATEIKRLSGLIEQLADAIGPNYGLDGTWPHIYQVMPVAQGQKWYVCRVNELFKTVDYYTIIGWALVQSSARDSGRHPVALYVDETVRVAYNADFYISENNVDEVKEQYQDYKHMFRD